MVPARGLGSANIIFRNNSSELRILFVWALFFINLLYQGGDGEGCIGAPTSVRKAELGPPSAAYAQRVTHGESKGANAEQREVTSASRAIQ